MGTTIDTSEVQRLAPPPELANSLREVRMTPEVKGTDGAEKTVAAVSSAQPKAQLRQIDEMRRNLSDAIEQVNEQLRKQAQNLNFAIDKNSGRTVITVRNTQSGEVVRQIPDDVVLKVAHNVEQLKGMLFNQLV